MTEALHVYTAICAVMADIGTTGISKGRRNQQQGYSFRGIDDVYNELNHLLAKHKLIMTPRILSREVVERQTAKGGALFYVTVEAEFDFVSAMDGSKHTVRTYGEAMDSADKATNKAMSAAYKYAAMMVFCIPTEGDNDADATTHEVAPAPRKSEASRTAYKMLQDKLRSITTRAELSEWLKDPSVAEMGQTLPADWSEDFKKEIRKRRAELPEGFAQIGDAFPGDRPNAYANAVMAG